LSDDSALAGIAAGVEATIKAIIDDAAASTDARAALLRRREALASEIRASARKRGAERGGNVPDSGELADEDVARDVAAAEIDRDSAEIEAIDAALARIEAGTYGKCTDCGAAIAAARLAHSPEVARCLPCQEKRERESQPRIARL
jgi:DnaK suppressor protein